MKPQSFKKLIPVIIAIGSVAYFFYNHNKKENGQLLLDKAIQEYNSGNLNSAKSDILAFSKQFELDSKAWSFLGTIYLETSNLDSAKFAYSKSLEANPKNHKSLTGMGIISRSKKDYEKAKDFYLQALDTKPNDPNALSSLVIIYLKQENFEDAVKIGEQAIKTKPVRLGIKGNLMIAYHFNNQLEKRDNLIKELKNEGYSNLDKLMLVVNGQIGLEVF